MYQTTETTGYINPVILSNFQFFWFIIHFAAFY